MNHQLKSSVRSTHRKQNTIMLVINKKNEKGQWENWHPKEYRVTKLCDGWQPFGRFTDDSKLYPVQFLSLKMAVPDLNDRMYYWDSSADATFVICNELAYTMHKIDNNILTGNLAAVQDFYRAYFQHRYLDAFGIYQNLIEVLNLYDSWSSELIPNFVIQFDSVYKAHKLNLNCKLERDFIKYICRVNNNSSQEFCFATQDLDLLDINKQHVYNTKCPKCVIQKSISTDFNDNLTQEKFCEIQNILSVMAVSIKQTNDLMTKLQHYFLKE